MLNWLHLSGEVAQPINVHPSRPVNGLGHTKQEPSGQRVWKLIRAIYGDSTASFFAYGGLLNLCPLAFFDAKGKNVTPETFKAENRKEFISICIRHFERIIHIIDPRVIVCFGRFVETCAKQLIVSAHRQIIYLPHPSPRAVNNQNWVEDTINLIRTSHPVIIQPNGGGHRRSPSSTGTE